MYADIIIDITHEKLDKIFQYRIPEFLEGELEIGMEVIVPFGRGSRETRGYVVGFSKQADYAEDKIKEIFRRAEDGMAIEAKLVKLAAWMRESYGGTMRQSCPSNAESGNSRRGSWSAFWRKPKAGSVWSFI